MKSDGVQEDPESVSKLILLDGSHRYMQTYRMVYRRAFGIKTEALAESKAFQTELLLGMAIRLSAAGYASLRKDLNAMGSWEERMGKVAQLVLAAGAVTEAATAEYVLNGIYAEFLMADRFHLPPSPPPWAPDVSLGVMQIRA